MGLSRQGSVRRRDDIEIAMEESMMEIVPRLDRADIDGSVVTAVAEAPKGAWPTSCHPIYPLDGQEFLNYVELSGTEGYDALVQSWSDRLLH
jgi:hypothetical protein